MIMSDYTYDQVADIAYNVEEFRKYWNG